MPYQAKLTSVIALGLAMLTAPPALADNHSHESGTQPTAVEVVSPWARASIGDARTGAAYMVLVNHSQETERLLTATAEVAPKVEIHDHVMEGEIVKMRQVEHVELAPGATVELAPGGKHIMFMGLHAPLVEGESFPLTLSFERAGEIEVTVEIKSPTASGGGAGGHGH